MKRVRSWEQHQTTPLNSLQFEEGEKKTWGLFGTVLQNSFFVFENSFDGQIKKMSFIKCGIQF